MTLLEDLALAAAYVGAAQNWGDPQLAHRLNDAASRLRSEMERAEVLSLRSWSRGRTKALVERINGGPVKP